MKKIFLLLIFTISFVGSNYAQDSSSTSKEDDDLEIDTYNYESSIIEFAEGIDTLTGESIHLNTVFTLKDNVAIVYLILYTNEPIMTQSLSINVYDEDGLLIDMFDVQTENSWKVTYFNLYFKLKGKYYVDIYNEYDMFVNSADIEIE